MFKKIKTVLDGILNLILNIKNYNEIKRISWLSVLSLGNIKQYSIFRCPICKGEDINLFVKLPLGAPGNQKHSLLYFDYKKIDMCLLKDGKDILDSTLGFFLLIPWNFCNDCKNASIGVSFSNEHLLEYYSKYYLRKGGDEPNRRSTKELHGKYLSSLLGKNSKILEIGAAEGFTAEYLADQGHEVFVYDPCSLKQKLKQVSSLKYLDNIDVEGMSFDAIYLHHVLEHIFDPISHVKILCRLLKEDGLLMLQVPDVSLQFGILKKLLKREIYAFFNPPYFSLNGIAYEFSGENAYHWFDALANDHVCAFTPEGLTYVLKRSGMQIIEIIRSTEERIISDSRKYSWPVDEITGNTPNSITVLAKRMDL